MPFAETVAGLLTAHLLGDFVFQPDWLLKAKGSTWWGLILHVAIVLAISVLLLGNFSWQMLAVIGASHLILDAVKVFTLPKVMDQPDGPWPFVIDQLIHFAFIVLVSAIWPSLFVDGVWDKYLPVTTDHDTSNWYAGALVLLSGLILCVPVGGILIAKVTHGLIDDEDDDRVEEKDDDREGDETENSVVADHAADVEVDATASAIRKAASAIETAAAAYTNSLYVPSSTTTADESLSEKDEASIETILRGLPDGGRYIGWLERTLVMLFVLSGYPQGIGFLIATKSILRFGDIKNWHQRAATEYVIIGTFLSFAWAMVIAGLTHQTLQVWFPPTQSTPAVIELTLDGGAPTPGGSTRAAALIEATPAGVAPSATAPADNSKNDNSKNDNSKNDNGKNDNSKNDNGNVGNTNKQP